MTNGKLDAKSDKCFFMGYPKETRGYSLYHPIDKKVFVARNGVFLEKEFLSNATSGRKIELEEIQDDEETTAPVQEHELEEQTVVPQNAQDTQEPRRSNRLRTQPERYGFILTFEGDVMLIDQDEPETYIEAISCPEAEEWRQAMQSEMDSMYTNQMANNNTNNLALRSILDKDKLNGTNFVDWQRNLSIVLRMDEKEYVLEKPIPPAPPANAPKAVRGAYDKHVKDDNQVSCVMLATMITELQKQHEDMKAHEMIVALRQLYQGQSRHECFLVKKLGFSLQKELATDLILQSLPELYKGFVMNYMMHDLDKPLPELLKMLLQRRTLLRARVLPSLWSKAERGSREKKRIKIKARTVGKPKSKSTSSATQKPVGGVAKGKCHHCGKAGHWRRNCKTYLATKKNEESTKVCKLQRSIYGLKQASRSWNIRFHETVIGFGFERNSDESCVYKKVSGSAIVFLALYVDDILLIGNEIPTLTTIKTWLSKSFSMKDLGDASYALGIRIYRDRSRKLLGLSQKAKEPRSHQKTKHIVRRYHIIREIVARGDVEICKIGTGDNIADSLTKALGKPKQECHTWSMGIREMLDWP
ncbi:unnamed protein product [Cuscuta campestris]|uniref:CCHC-type domain-containing protein n=1 Tax=Cuscuta campestris TaxID=132261 RepID=A0A484MCV7_9ASTE|nr:unnamed protein product [Cuscuta campestris]